ncbi:hypothetical protein EV426DRAFT_706063 [Tirmania nivea]|nr:hypothetical protein EV426DRAFT_706063 [Tirmania nivea]
MCDDLLAHHHRISAPSSIPLSENPTWFTTQPAKPTDAPPRTYLFLPLSFSIDPATCQSPPAAPAARRTRTKTPVAPGSAPSAPSATTTFGYFPAFFDINKRWTIYAFDKSVLALYPQKADRCEMVYEMVYSHAQHAHHPLPTQHHHRDHHHSPHHSPHHSQPMHSHSNLHNHSSPPRGRVGYPSSTPHSRSNSPGPHHHPHHLPHTPNLTSSYDLVEDTTWFTSTHPHLRTLLSPPGGSGGEKCLSLIDLHSTQKRAGYILLSLPTPSSPNRIYISQIEIFPEYRGAGGGRHWSLVGRGLVRMLLEAVVEVAGDFGGSGIAGEGVDVWINLGAESETEVATCALGMGWVVNRCLWVVERNEVEEVEDEEEEEGKKEESGEVAVQAEENKREDVEKAQQQQQQQQQKDATAAAGTAHTEENSLQQQQHKEAKRESPAAAVDAHAGAPVGSNPPNTSHSHAQGNSKQGGKHWSFGEWGRGMKGWRERWVRALEDISHGHGHGHGHGKA